MVDSDDREYTMSTKTISMKPKKKRMTFEDKVQAEKTRIQELLDKDKQFSR